MDNVYDKCCGIDLHKKLIVACFKQGNRQEVREFGAATRPACRQAGNFWKWLTGSGKAAAK